MATDIPYPNGALGVRVEALERWREQTERAGVEAIADLRAEVRALRSEQGRILTELVEIRHQQDARMADMERRIDALEDREHLRRGRSDLWNDWRLWLVVAIGVASLALQFFAQRGGP